jgi:hypothetical protein
MQYEPTCETPCACANSMRLDCRTGFLVSGTMVAVSGCLAGNGDVRVISAPCNRTRAVSVTLMLHGNLEDWKRVFVLVSHASPRTSTHFIVPSQLSIACMHVTYPPPTQNSLAPFKSSTFRRSTPSSHNVLQIAFRVPTGHDGWFQYLAMMPFSCARPI